MVVEVEADDGTVGVGVSIGGEPACFIVENHLSRFVEGQDPRCAAPEPVLVGLPHAHGGAPGAGHSDVELMWDQMWR